MSGSEVKDLGLETEKGRYLLKNIRFPQVQKTGEIHFHDYRSDTVRGNINFENAKWKSIHFRDCDISNSGFFSCIVDDCVFENTNCKGVGFWESSISDCRFDRCNLRSAAFGGIDTSNPEAPSQYTRTTFSECDLRSSAHSCELFQYCLFYKCKLDSVNFHGAVFEDSKFVGILNEVEFRGYIPSCTKMRRNRLLRCDFREAKLVSCQFMYIDMDSVLLSDDPDIIILPRGPIDLQEWQEKFPDNNFYISYVKEYSGTPAIQSRSDLLESFTPEQVQWLIDITNAK